MPRHRATSTERIEPLAHPVGEVALPHPERAGDYPAASDFINVLLSCAGFHAGSDSSINIAGYCDKTSEAGIAQALKTGQTSGLAAAEPLWGKVDAQIMANAPVAPLITPKLVDFTSKRVGNYQFSKQFYMLVDQLWVQ